MEKPTRLVPPCDVCKQGGLLDRLNTTFSESRGGWVEWKAGYHLRWSGWLPAQNTALLVAWWTAYNPELKTGFYASTPGSEGPYRPGEAFDIGVRGKQFLTWNLFHEVDEEELCRRAWMAKEDAHDRLLRTMREHGIEV